MDCSGKTTIIENLLRKIPNSIYCKGIGKEDIIGNLARLFHSTLSFSLEIIFRTYKNIIPNLKRDKIVLQDRYLISISSYLPNTERFYNRLILNMIKPFLVEPDAVVYLTLPIKERIKRLKEKGTHYEGFLAKNPKLIKLREEEYQKWFNELKCPKIKIDTHANSLDKSVKIAGNFIQQSMFQCPSP